MPRQNRVTPSGDLVAATARGTLMGNRGCLHNLKGEIVRSFQVKRWIICLLSFNGRQREVMKPGHYTELFFLDEAVALAAGHRPCAECQRDRYNLFRAIWAQANRDRIPTDNPRADAMDAVLHADRLTSDRQQRTYLASLHALPDGVFVHVDNDAQLYLWWRGRLLAYTPEGYGSILTDKVPGQVTVLTPRSTVRALAAGYTPDVHASSGQLSSIKPR